LYEQRTQYWVVVEDLNNSIWRGVGEYMDPPDHRPDPLTIPEDIVELDVNVDAELAWELLSELTIEP
jgi:hypothetical protein